jgi:hypothetical protein
MPKTLLMWAWLACLAVPLHAQQSGSLPITGKLFTGRLPAGWTITEVGSEVEARPPAASESELVHVFECPASSTNCLSACTDAAARNYLWFLKKGDPPATRSSVERGDHLVEYRADGKFGDSAVWAAASVLCGDSGLVVVFSVSEARSLAISYVDTVVGSVSWRK